VLDDVLVPKGTVLLMPQWVVHRDARWFPEPLQFRPERWLEGEERPKFSFFPFGGGQRVCVGNHFARMEAVLVLATVLQRWELRPQESFELQVFPSVTLRPRAGIVVRRSARAAHRGATVVRCAPLSDSFQPSSSPSLSPARTRATTTPAATAAALEATPIS
jgi:Cytochrome P450